MAKPRYVIRPRADRDLEDQAFYYAERATPELGDRFLLAAHETFELLASQPEIGWNAKWRHSELQRMRVFRVRGFEKILILYLPIEDGVDILRVIHGARDLSSAIVE